MKSAPLEVFALLPRNSLLHILVTDLYSIDSALPSPSSLEMLLINVLLVTTIVVLNISTAPPTVLCILLFLTSRLAECLVIIIVA